MDPTARQIRPPGTLSPNTSHYGQINHAPPLLHPRRIRPPDGEEARVQSIWDEYPEQPRTLPVRHSPAPPPAAHEKRGSDRFMRGSLRSGDAELLSASLATAP